MRRDLQHTTGETLAIVPTLERVRDSRSTISQGGTFVSYAQNFEDVLLWRALSDVAAGFYIDVGAWHPDTDSVTRAFYDRGWHGINIEPVQEMHRRLTAARPRDLNLPCVAGDADGEATLFVVPGTGLSTLLPGGLTPGAQPQTVRMRTLASICRDYVGDQHDLHFLKIDVEGAEPIVLAGADFRRFRPWLVLVEATAPLSTVETHDTWEHILLAAEYRFVWFDGLNRFYVAAERHAALAPRFRAPPNVFDDFVRASDSAWARRIATAEAAAVELAYRAERAEQRVDAQAVEFAAQRQLAAQLGEEAMALRALLARQDSEFVSRQAAANLRLSELTAALRLAEDWVAAFRASTSWRITAPLRHVATLLGRTRNRRTPPAKADKPDAAPAAAYSSVSDSHGCVLPAAPASRVMRPHAVRAVHQFHSGSAVGDAITNAMLLTRALLRGLGFISEIYVAHLDPALADELLPAGELPRHDDYVLIVRHSMGFDLFDMIAALPATKVLLYHNITPEQFLPQSGPLRACARLGRQQLAALRDHVVASLADSEYNAIELRRLGFDPVQCCTLLFDVADLRHRAAVTRVSTAGTPFTVLFVGRIIESKGQRELVAAFAAFRARYAGSARLVLVGRHEHDAYYHSLRRDIDGFGLNDHVVLTGLVADGELDAWFAEASLYVSLSSHEGFGVPLIEAMAHGVPVLAYASGAVPFTIGGAGELLHDRAAAPVADAMLALAKDATRRAAISARQFASLDRFALAGQTPILMQALARAGAAPVPDVETRARIAANMQVTVTGHVRGSYSLARVNRALTLALERHAPRRVRLVPVAGEADLAGLPDGERASIAALIDRPAPDSGPHIVISQHYPLLPVDLACDAAVALVFWEESLLPPSMVALLNERFDGVLAPSGFVAKVLIDSGVTLPMRVVGLVPPRGDRMRDSQTRPSRQRADKFTFLHVSSCFPRKGIDVLLAAYARAFRRDDRVRLIVKSFPNPHNDVREQIDRLRQDHPDVAEVVGIDADLDEAALAKLYDQADVLVLPTRGEGYNLPAAEAMADGIPVIVTGYGGHMDFCTAESARLLRFRFSPSGSHLATPHSVWVEPDLADLTTALREATTPAGREIAQSRAAVAAPRAAQLGGQTAERITQAALDILLAPPRGRVRLGWLSSWDVRCGVAEYSRHLLGAVSSAGGHGPAFSDICVFADHRTTPAPAGAGAVAEIQAAWSIGMADGVAELATAIAAADPHVLMVQHQPGLFGWDRLATLLAQPALSRRMVAVTLHTTRNLLDTAPETRDAAVANLQRVARVLVHTLADLNLLASLGLTHNTTLLPHGAPAAGPARQARPLPASVAPVIGCYGFLLPGKGIPQLIEAMASLRATWPRAHLRLVNAIYPGAESAAELATCRDVVQAHGLSGAVEWHTDFLPHERSLALLADCDVVALPYQASQEASSAALRTALAAGPPVLVTPLALFDEAEPAIVRSGGTDATDLAQALARLLADTALRDATKRAAREWLAERSWDAIGQRLCGMLRGLQANRGHTPVN